LLAVAADQNAVSVVEGTAGAGKTFTMETVAEADRENGYQVHGLAVAWTGARNLKNEGKLESGRAIEGWIRDAKAGKLKIPRKDVEIEQEQTSSAGVTTHSQEALQAQFEQARAAAAAAEQRREAEKAKTL